MVLLWISRVAELMIPPPPSWLAEMLPETVVLVIARVPELAIPPPPPELSECVCINGARKNRERTRTKDPATSISSGGGRYRQFWHPRDDQHPVSGNISASQLGGGGIINSATLLIHNSTIASNTATMGSGWDT